MSLVLGFRSRGDEFVFTDRDGNDLTVVVARRNGSVFLLVDRGETSELVRGTYPLEFSLPNGQRVSINPGCRWETLCKITIDMDSTVNVLKQPAGLLESM